MTARSLMIVKKNQPQTKTQTKSQTPPQNTWFSPVAHHSYSNTIFPTVTQNQPEPILICNAEELQARYRFFENNISN